MVKGLYPTMGKTSFVQPLLCILLLLAGSATKAQSLIQTPVHTAVNSNIGGYYEALPPDYHSNPTKKYPLLIFVHGIGETGDGSPLKLPKVLRNGPPKLIDNG